MKIIEIQPVREWQEKEGDKITGRIWIYAGSLHVGICTRLKNETGDIERYHFDSLIKDIDFMSNTKARSLEEIKIDVEAALKEFVSKFMKSYRTFKKVEKGNG